MKKIIYKTLFFLTPIVLLLLGVELFYQIVPNNYTSKSQHIQKKYDDTKILILGNSHAFYGLNPKYFDKSTFNLSNISQTLYFDELLFEKHIDKLKKLEYVILNIEYTSLSQLDNTQEDVWRKYYYKRYMDLDVPIVSVFDPKCYFLSLNKNFESNFKLIKRYFSEGTIIDCDEYGFGVNYTKELKKSNFDSITPIIIKRHEDNSLNFANNINRIQAIINICKSKGIKVVLVTMPVIKGYAQGVNQVKLNKIFKTCLSFEKNNENVHYLNLFNDFRFTNEDFYDPDHLHSEGAKKCSMIMNEFLINIKS